MHQQKAQTRAPAISLMPILLAVGVILLPATSSAGPREQILVGARPLGMGEAFVAVADDGTALFWNPAGIVLLDHHEVASMYSDLFGMGISNGYLGYVYPLTDRYAVGADWFHVGFDDGELGFTQNVFKVSGAYRAMQNLSVGLNAKYLNSRTEIAFGPEGGSDGFGLDAGVLWTPRQWLRFGIMAHDLTDTRLRHDNGTSEVIYHRSVRYGAAVRPWENSLIAVDFDDRFHLGAEHWLARSLALRSGIQKDLHTSERITFSAGLGIAYQFLRFDYAFTDAPTLGTTHRISVSAAFNLGRSVIDIRECTIDEIFPSQALHYVTDPPADITLFNRSEEPIEARVSLDIPDFMDSPSEISVVLRPQVVTSVQVPAHFNDQLLLKASDRPIRAVVTTSYLDDRKTRTSKTTARTMAYSRGAIRWGTGSAAAFVTSTDPVVDRFARGVVREIDDSVWPGLDEPNLMRAAAVFEAIGEAGIRYVPDPHNPYSTVSLAESAVDNVQFPRDLLQSKAGDCDDCAILYCALVENLGIATALVDVPGHLLMMVDAGIHPRHRLGLALAEDMTVVWRDRVWIPMEASMFGSSFASAWRQGAARISSLPSDEQPGLIDIHEAWGEYPPPDLPGAAEVPTVDPSRVRSLLQRDEETITGWQETYLASTYADILAGETGGTEPVRQLARTGNLDQAREAAQRNLQAHPKVGTVWNDAGNVYALAGEWDSAAVCYERAMNLSAESPEAWFNRGMLEIMLGRSDSADSFLQRVRVLCPTSEAIEQDLGLKPPGHLRSSEIPDPASLLWDYLTPPEDSTAVSRDRDRRILTALAAIDKEHLTRLLCWGRTRP